MTREEFLHDIEEIISDTLFIGESEEEEISNNMWQISISHELANSLKIEDFSTFFKRVILNRKMQVQTLKPTIGMLFYLWFDEQASQIRFSIISNRETGLPFSCEIIPTNNYEVIIKDFLEHPYHNGIPTENMIAIDFNNNCGEESADGVCLQKVYSVTL